MLVMIELELDTKKTMCSAYIAKFYLSPTSEDLLFHCLNIMPIVCLIYSIG